MSTCELVVTHSPEAIVSCIVVVYTIINLHDHNLISCHSHFIAHLTSNVFKVLIFRRFEQKELFRSMREMREAIDTSFFHYYIYVLATQTHTWKEASSI